MTTARQNLSRNWQNGRLWWNDPDAVVLAGELTDAECQFHATAIYASGGMVLSGDDLTAMPPARAAMLRKLLPPTGVAARVRRCDAAASGTMRLPDALDDLPVQLGRRAADADGPRCRPRPTVSRLLDRRTSLGRREGVHVARDGAAIGAAAAR